MANRRGQDKQSYLVPIFASILSSVVAVSGSWLAFKSDINQADVDLVKSFSEQLTVVQEKLFAAQMKIVRLELELGSKYGAHDTLKDYLDSMTYPAWVKVAEEDPTDPATPRIKMWYINTAYENFFKVKRDYYIGKTDFDVWPLAVATKFYMNDLHVLSRSSSTCISESFPDKIFDGKKTITGYSCKGAFKLQGWRAVAGQVLIPGEHVKGDKL